MRTTRIGDREYGLFFSVRAKLEMEKRSPDGSFEAYLTRMQGIDTGNVEAIAEVVTLLNEEYERKMIREAGEPVDANMTYSTFDPEELYYIPFGGLIDIMEDITQVIAADSERRVETKKEKKQGKRREKP